MHSKCLWDAFVGRDLDGVLTDTRNILELDLLSLDLADQRLKTL